MKSHFEVALRSELGKLLTVYTCIVYKYVRELTNVPSAIAKFVMTALRLLIINMMRNLLQSYGVITTIGELLVLLNPYMK